MTRKLPPMDERVETGAVQFGNDWPGIFIRGDDAAFYAMALDSKLEGAVLSDHVRSSLKRLLQSCIVAPKENPNG